MRILALMLCLAAIAGCGGDRRVPDGPRIVSATASGDRVVDLVVRSGAMHRDVPVRLLLPQGFEGTTRRYPVLYLLHGCCDSWVAWTRSTDVEALSARDDVIVAMPDGGRAGFYSDWLRGPRWETFHVDELPEVLEDRYRASGTRAVAGVSMGGLGAMAYAARHPGAFRAAASFSGVLDTRGTTGARGRFVLGLLAAEGERGMDLWGDPHSHARIWAAHNPADLAPRLRGTVLFVSAGSGAAPRGDPLGVAATLLERIVGRQSATFVARLRRERIAVVADLGRRGTHTWPSWQRALHRSWPLLMAALGTR
jgi:diacylglycerol O-acyltransferase / trehalose O-mycolyltransferase